MSEKLSPSNVLDCFGEPEPSMPAYETWRVVYSDGTRVLYKPDDEIVTFFKDGSIHREYPAKPEDRYQAPASPSHL